MKKINQMKQQQKLLNSVT